MPYGDRWLINPMNYHDLDHGPAHDVVVTSASQLSLVAADADEGQRIHHGAG